MKNVFIFHGYYFYKIFFKLEKVEKGRGGGGGQRMWIKNSLV